MSQLCSLQSPLVSLPTWVTVPNHPSTSVSSIKARALKRKSHTVVQTALMQHLAFSSGFIYSVSVIMLSVLLHHHLEQDSIIIANIRHEKNSKSKSLGPCSTEILDSTPVLSIRLKLGPQHTKQCGRVTH